MPDQALARRWPIATEAAEGHGSYARIRAQAVPLVWILDNGAFLSISELLAISLV